MAELRSFWFFCNPDDSVTVQLTVKRPDVLLLEPNKPDGIRSITFDIAPEVIQHIGHLFLDNARPGKSFYWRPINEEEETVA